MNAGIYISSIIPIIIAMKIRQIIKKFKDTSSTTPLSSKTLDELNISPRLIFKRLLYHNVIIETDNRYYLNLDNYESYRKRRRITFLIIIGVLIFVLLMINILLINY